MKQHFKNKMNVIGIMSGTSLDGLDLVAAEFHQVEGNWNFAIYAAETIPYSAEREEKLKNSPSLSMEKLLELHAEYGRFIGTETNLFIEKTGFIPDLIASHGHTVFHQPEKGFTFQVGYGAKIAATTKITTVSDFRTEDVALGGQGAPLVPVGDRLLFSDYDYCLNLGGFANISFEKNNQRVAFDICPVNFILNYFAVKQGLPFDKGGELGRKGNINNDLLKKLNHLNFYLKQPPKSLGREWMEQVFMPVLTNCKITEKDKLRTIYEHIAQQIANAPSGSGKMLVTGGGAFNTFLIKRISNYTDTVMIIPQKEIVNFKEALIFAFLGVLRIQNKTNCLASVTGALHDHCAGIVFQP